MCDEGWREFWEKLENWRAVGALMLRVDDAHSEGAALLLCLRAKGSVTAHSRHLCLLGLLYALREALAPSRYSKALLWFSLLTASSEPPCDLFRPLATIARDVPLQQPGDKLYGFTVERIQEYPEVQTQAWQLRHDQTGAEYLHLKRDDSNNVFSIAFKTNPPDATGVPHILEHTTLCGSQKYPVRDPFFKMLPRSLSNLMNAWTHSDFTQYPFATTNEQDFKNLMSVYMDATLHPLLKASDFKQEGWRIGPEHPLGAPKEAGDSANATNPLVFKGVVYNEMKGQMSDASYLFYVRFQEHLIPSLNNSGGDPQNITDLTHEQLTKFHADHYHPSNAKIFTYGDIPLERNLEHISQSLQGFNSSPSDTRLIDPIDLSKGPVEITVDGPVDSLLDINKQHKTSLSWVLGDNTDIVERMAYGMIANLLTSGFGSPMYRSLIESGLATTWAPNNGFGQLGTKTVLTLGGVGVAEENVRRVKEVIYETLAEVSQRGLEKRKIEGLLHQFELGLKHKTASFGESVMSRITADWFNGVDVFETLATQKVIDEFKGLIEKGFLNNNTLSFTMRPSTKFAEEHAAEEKARLAKKIAEVNSKFGGEDKAREFLEAQELDLMKAQAAPQDLSVLPTLRVSDIERKKLVKKVTHSQVDGVPVQWREAPTNGLTYFRAINTFPELPEELRQLVPLFTDCLHRLGTRNRTMEQIEEDINLKVGRVSIDYHSTTSISDVGSWNEGFSFSGFALDRHVPAMFDLLRELVLETNFDGSDAAKQIQELLQMTSSMTLDTISGSGNAYAIKLARSALTPEAHAVEQIAGIHQLKFSHLLSQRQSLESVIKQLKEIQKYCLSSMGKMRVAITCGTESREANEKSLSSFLAWRPEYTSNITERFASHSMGYTRQLHSKVFLEMPSFHVGYVGLAVPAVPYTHPSSPSLAVLSQLLNYKHLHPTIRERGGAYGAGSSAPGVGGTFSMWSYRDPSPSNTLEVFRSAGAWAVQQNFSATDLEEAKISIFKGLDAPESINMEGITEFEIGLDPATQQARRDALFDVTEEQVKAAAREFLLDNIGSAREVVISPARPKRDETGWTTIRNLALFKDQSVDAQPKDEKKSGGFLGAILGAVGAKA
ncbi:mitochondrial presequence protease [Microthyrium microscopicum]|uniref:Presequence protease, mitochondrial n=1 Tax=Microthyrium microscopicum TaxID=703497 RepID=A0A6A6UF27_9PEZI|nr:mitochondrial presequence protease [Microthyrium microscopicum]